MKITVILCSCLL